MLILIGLVVLLIGCIIGTYKISNNFEFGIVLFGFLVVVFLIIWPTTYYSNYTRIEQFKTTKTVIEDARNNPNSGIEIAALTIKIVEKNEWLVSMKYWNNTTLDMFIPNEIEKLELLK